MIPRLLSGPTKRQVPPIVKTGADREASSPAKIPQAWTRIPVLASLTLRTFLSAY